MKSCPFVLAAVLALVLGGCAGGPSARLDVARRAEAVQSPLLTPDQRQAMAEGRVLPGMSEEMVAASWGVPRRMESRQETHALLETWEFGPRVGAPFGARLTFEDGILERMERPSGADLLGVIGVDSPSSASMAERSTAPQFKRY